MLSVQGVTKYFTTVNGVTNALENITLQFYKGEFVTLVGPSGCGKSTLLNIIAGLEPATQGQVVKYGHEITSAGPDRVVMFQEAALFPWLKVIDNVEYGMKVAGVPKKIRKEKAFNHLKMVHMARFYNLYPHELSGGMRQRVALARALAMDSDILLMDEPFAALDGQTRSILHTELQQIWQATGKTIIFVTHNVEEAVCLADRVVVMSANPGRIKREFKVELDRPRNHEAVEFSGFISMIMQELKEEIELVAKAEYDSDWSPRQKALIPTPTSNIGT